MSPVANGTAMLCLALHAAPAPSPLPHWAVLVTATLALGATIAVGVALVDRLLDRLLA